MAREPIRQQKYIDIPRLSLFTNHPEIPDVRCRLSWAWTPYGYPRASIFLNDPGKRQNPRDNIINAPMGLHELMAFIEKAPDIITGHPRTYFKMSCKTNIWRDNKRTDELVLVSDFILAKDDAGVLWITIAADGKPKVKFQLIPTNYHDFVNMETKERLTASEASVLVAKGYFELVKNIFTAFAANSAGGLFDPPNEPNTDEFTKDTSTTISNDLTFDDDVSF